MTNASPPAHDPQTCATCTARAVRGGPVPLVELLPATLADLVQQAERAAEERVR